MTQQQSAETSYRHEPTPQRSGPVGVGFIGTGMISDTYLENLTRFPDTNVVILGDLDQDRARTQAESTAFHSGVDAQARSSMSTCPPM
jgi:predicted dehydrogenase